MAEDAAAAGGVDEEGGAPPATRRTPRRLTRSAREDFLSQLAATAHVEMAAGAADVGIRAVYTLRQRDPAFAVAWRDALAVGYERIEAALIRKALGLADHPPIARAEHGELEYGEIDVSVAIMLLDRHRATGARTVKETRGVAFRATRDGAEATLLATLKAHGRRVAARADAARA